jgi:hypothetical protein
MATGILGQPEDLARACGQEADGQALPEAQVQLAVGAITRRVLVLDIKAMVCAVPLQPLTAWPEPLQDLWCSLTASLARLNSPAFHAAAYGGVWGSRRGLRRRETGLVYGLPHGGAAKSIARSPARGI